ncbi:MAG: Rv2175c family DNA-binding protein [Micrococcales bacterium]
MSQVDLEKATEWITIPEVAEKLNLPLGKVHRLIEEHSLIEHRFNGVRKVPAIAIKDSEPLANLRGTVLVLLDAGFSLEAAIEWLLTEDDTLKDLPLAALAAGKKAEIRRLAQALAF